MTSGKRIPSSVAAKRSRVAAGSAQPAASLPEPLASRPRLPKNYGVRANNRGLLPWSWAVERLEKSKNYWVASTRPDGRPHVMPVWAAWIANSLWFGTDTSTRKARNLAANPSVVVHLQSGDEAVIVEGIVREVTESSRLSPLNSAFKKKYGIGLSRQPGTVVYTVEPHVAFGWRERDFPVSATRWSFAA